MPDVGVSQMWHVISRPQHVTGIRPSARSRPGCGISPLCVLHNLQSICRSFYRSLLTSSARAYLSSCLPSTPYEILRTTHSPVSCTQFQMVVPSWPFNSFTRASCASSKSSAYHPTALAQIPYFHSRNPRVTHQLPPGLGVPRIWRKQIFLLIHVLKDPSEELQTAVEKPLIRHIAERRFSGSFEFGSRRVVFREVVRRHEALVERFEADGLLV